MKTGVVGKLMGIPITVNQYLPETRERCFKFRYKWWIAIAKWKRYYYLNGTIDIRRAYVLQGKMIICNKNYWEKVAFELRALKQEAVCLTQ